MVNIFDINLVCLDGGDHLMENVEIRSKRDLDSETCESPPADFIRTPVSANDQLDAAEVGGVIDFDLDDDGANSSEEEGCGGGISDNDSDDTAPAVEEVTAPKREHHAEQDQRLSNNTLGNNAPSGDGGLKIPIERWLRRAPFLHARKPWHLQMLESLFGNSPPANQAESQNLPSAAGGAMTYEEALSRRPARRQCRARCGERACE